jgi:hypothetical protein
LTLEQLAALMDGFELAARANFAKDGELTNITIMLGTRTPDGEPHNHLAILPWCEVGPDKDAVRAAQQRMVDVIAPTCVINITEGWAVALPEEHGPVVDLESLGQPSKHPERIEIIMLRGECRAGVVHRTIEIHRDADGSVALGDTQEARVTGVAALTEGLASRFGGYFTPPEGKA